MTVEYLENVTELGPEGDRLFNISSDDIKSQHPIKDNDDEDVSIDNNNKNNNVKKDNEEEDIEIEDYDIKVEFANLNIDSSPYHSITEFVNLNLPEFLLDELSKCGLMSPSKIQEQVLPLALQLPYMNLIAQSQAGTGKTVSLAIITIARIESDLKSTQVAIVVNSRELAMQVSNNIKSLSGGKYNAHLAIPGVRARQQITSPVVIGTPKTLINQLYQQAIKFRQLKVWIVDEADFMLQQDGMREDMIDIRKFLPEKVQMILMSATFEEETLEFAKLYAPNSNVMILEKKELNVKSIKHYYIKVDEITEKNELINEIFGSLSIGQSIIFVNRRYNAIELCKYLADRNYSVSLVTGQLRPEERDEAMIKFRTQNTRVLIATDVISRGVDVPTVTMVINFDLPDSKNENENDMTIYYHRVGRTGRFGRNGVSIDLIKGEMDYEKMLKFQNNMNIKSSHITKENLKKIAEVVNQ